MHILNTEFTQIGLILASGLYFGAKVINLWDVPLNRRVPFEVELINCIGGVIVELCVMFVLVYTLSLCVQ